MVPPYDGNGAGSSATGATDTVPRGHGILEAEDAGEEKRKGRKLNREIWSGNKKKTGPGTENYPWPWKGFSREIFVPDFRIHLVLFTMFEPSQWVSTAGTAGMVASQLMNLSVLPVVLSIISSRSTLQYPSFPLTVAISNSIHGIIYASATSSVYNLMSSTLTLLFNLVYICIHLRYSMNRNRILKEILLIPILTTVVSIAYISSSCPDSALKIDYVCLKQLRTWLGIVSTLSSSLSYCGQLSTIRKVFRTKSALSISPWMTGGVALRACAWFIHSLLINDGFYVFSSCVGMISTVIQVYLLIKFQPKSDKPKNA